MDLLVGDYDGAAAAIIAMFAIAVVAAITSHWTIAAVAASAGVISSVYWLVARRRKRVDE